MLDLARLDNFKLSPSSRAQRTVGRVLLMPSFACPPRTHIIVDGIERIPEHPVIYAMNHTDRFNYWPFQYILWRQADRHAATWVKGKYYGNPLIAAFLRWTNNIPTVSRGYVITQDFARLMKRRPSEQEYGILRHAVDHGLELSPTANPELPAPLLTQARSILGYAFEPRSEHYATAINQLFGKMMGRFVALNGEAFAHNLDLLIFPEGTRSLRLGRGRIGLAQVAMHLEATVVPVGCSGSDKVYPGSSPLAKSGTIHYRIGEPMPYESFRELHVPRGFEPFSLATEERFRPQFQAYVDRVMAQINELLDPPYRSQLGDDAQAERGSHRFV